MKDKSKIKVPFNTREEFQKRLNENIQCEIQTEIWRRRQFEIGRQYRLLIHTERKGQE